MVVKPKGKPKAPKMREVRPGLSCSQLLQTAHAWPSHGAEEKARTWEFVPE
jgi:hypothetical protein